MYAVQGLIDRKAACLGAIRQGKIGGIMAKDKSSLSASAARAASRRSLLKTGAALGSIVGLGTLGFGPKGLKLPLANAAITDEYYPEPPPKFNAGPVFLRASGLSQPRPTGLFPVLQGATSQTETQFRILVKSNRVYRYWVIDGVGGGRRQVAPKSRSGVPTSQGVVDHVFVDGLQPDTMYWLEIEATGAGQTTERRQFSTMSTKNRAGDPLRIALISCLNDRYVDDQSDMWEAVAKSSPELMIFNGDCCYVDQRWDGTTEGMWTRHLETRRMLDVFKWDRLIPILTTWDDHDTAANDSDSSNPLLPTAREYFTAMFASDPVQGITTTSGLDYVFDTHGMRFVFLDDRSNKAWDRIYSDDQEKWLGEQIASSPGPIWLINGIQFWGAYLIGAESLEYNARAQLNRIMKMGEAASSPIIFCSGDVHFSELMEIEDSQMGYKTYELTSSALHSRTFPGIQFRSHNSRRLESTSRYNFMAVEMRAKSKAAVEFETVSLGAAQAEYFRFKGEVKV